MIGAIFEYTHHHIEHWVNKWGKHSFKVRLWHRMNAEFMVLGFLSTFREGPFLRTAAARRRRRCTVLPGAVETAGAGGCGAEIWFSSLGRENYGDSASRR